MSRRCADCKVPASDPCECLAVLSPERYGHFCAWAKGDDEQLHKVILGRSRLGLDPKPPGLVRKAMNLAGAVMQHLSEGAPLASEEQQAARLATCRANRCGYYRDGDVCAHQGCGCSLVVKVSWADQSCPLEPPMWGPVTATGAQER